MILEKSKRSWTLTIALIILGSPSLHQTQAQVSGVSFFDANTGVAVGWVGKIFRTTDAGAVWTRQGSPTINQLWDVSFGIQGTAMAVGDGTVLRTTDGGDTWTDKSFTPGQLRDVFFTDPDVGTAVGAGGRIYRTTDGGMTWDEQFSEDITLNSVFFTDQSTGTAVGTAGLIFHTTNEGLSWDLQLVCQCTEFMSVFFTDGSTGFAVGTGGTFYYTTDAGTTWEPRSIGTTAILSSIFFSDQSTGTIVGSGGTILRTTNGGVSWNSQSSGTTDYLADVFFTDASNGTAVGGSGSNDIILRTVDGGATWMNSVIVAVEDDPEILIPLVTELSQNYPNPFNAITNFGFQISDLSQVSLQIFDLLGREVATIVSERLAPGSYTRQWDAAGLASGVYAYRLVSGTNMETRKLVLIR